MVDYFDGLFGTPHPNGPLPLCPSYALCALLAHAAPCWDGFTAHFVCVGFGVAWGFGDPCTRRLIKRHSVISPKLIIPFL